MNRLLICLAMLALLAGAFTGGGRKMKKCSSSGIPK